VIAKSVFFLFYQTNVWYIVLKKIFSTTSLHVNMSTTTASPQGDTAFSTDNPTNGHPTPPAKLSLPFLSLLSGLTAIGQFATSVYLPSLPSIGREFGASVQTVQLTLLVYLVFFAVAQLAFGPLTDRFGRKPIVFIGIATFLVGSGLSFAAPSIDALIAGRALQAIGGAATMVTGRAIARDTHSGVALAQALAIITIVFSAAPGLAPPIGGFLEVAFGWRTTFLAAFALATFMLVCALVWLKETLVVRSSSLTLSSIGTLYAPIFRSRRFIAYIGASSFAMGGLYVFFGGGPQLFISDLHVSPAEYGIYPVFTVLGFVAGGIIARKVVEQVGVKRLMLFGLLLLSAVATLMLAFPMLNIVNKFIYNACMFVYVAGLGVGLALSIAEALRDFPERAGAASAMAGFWQMLGASAGTFLVGRLAHIQFLSVPLGMVIMGLGGVVFFLVMARED
jgi:DHA1 family bicyclomycin/chloramphenicol resistance-like MFS transporter